MIRVKFIKKNNKVTFITGNNLKHLFETALEYINDGFYVATIGESYDISINKILTKKEVNELQMD